MFAAQQYISRRFESVDAKFVRRNFSIGYSIFKLCVRHLAVWSAGRIARSWWKSDVTDYWHKIPGTP
jgi:hypothetical protein